MTQEELTANYIKLLPIIGDSFNESPLYISLGEDSNYYSLFADASQVEFQQSLEELIERKGKTWSVSGYLENRSTMLREIPHMVAEKRFYHLGIDINLPCGTKLYAPYDCEVALSKYEDGYGNYGGITVLKFQSSKTYYMLFGHLNPDKLPIVGEILKKGEAFAQLGNMSENGNWFYHTHLQVLTPKAYKGGWVSKGYCKESELPTIKQFCPDPLEHLSLSHE